MSGAKTAATIMSTMYADDSIAGTSERKARRKRLPARGCGPDVMTVESPPRAAAAVSSGVAEVISALRGVLEPDDREVGHVRVRVVARDVLARDEDAVLEHEGRDRRLLHDLLVEVAPRRRRLVRRAHRLDLIDAAVDVGVVELREVLVAAIRDVAAVEQ